MILMMVVLSNLLFFTTVDSNPKNLWVYTEQSKDKPRPSTTFRTKRIRFSFKKFDYHPNMTLKIPGVEGMPQETMHELYNKVNHFLRNLVIDENMVRKKRKHNAFLFIDELCGKIQQSAAKAVNSRWIYEANMTKYNKKKMITMQEKFDFMRKTRWRIFRNYKWTDEFDEYYDVLDRFYTKFNKVIGEQILAREKRKRYKQVLMKMEETYNSARFCKYEKKKKKRLNRKMENCKLVLDPDLKQIFATNRKPKELHDFWEQWMIATGQRLSRDLFKEYVDITNEVARLNNFTDAEQMWNDKFETKNFTGEMHRLWEEIKPVYVELHNYVRNRLRKFYGKNVIKQDGPIPAHLLGDVTGKNWINLYDITIPFPEDPFWNVTQLLIDKNYTSMRMFRDAEDFYESLGFGSLPGTFWDKSIFEHIKGRQMICEPSAWDFYGKHDYRVRMCTNITAEDYLRAHYEVGHVYQFRFYTDQPFIYKEGSNPAYFEAIPGVINLSVMSPSNLKRRGLLDNNAVISTKKEINYLFKIALELLPSLSFNYLIDYWRWDVFRNKTNPMNYNRHFWDLRYHYQGIIAPSERTENYFDPGSIQDVIKNTPSIKYFLSTFYQFQYHRRLCNYTSIEIPMRINSKVLHLCDIYECGDCGHALWKEMFYGGMHNWTTAMFLSIDEIWNDAHSIKDYFSPLTNWLRKENRKNNEFIGWN